MTLREARVEFTEAIVDLIRYMNDTEGYQAAFSEGMDRRTEKDPTSDHMKNSLHDIGLAQDIDLYRWIAGEWGYCDKTEDHTPFGEWWEQEAERRGLPLRWGGRFGDGNHYSMEYQGRK